MGWLAAWEKTIQLALRIWDYISGRPRQKLHDRRIELEAESCKALLDGDLVALRRTRAQLEEVDRKLRTGDY